jgi:hypothetical protein
MLAEIHNCVEEPWRAVADTDEVTFEKIEKLYR